jgi:hypothetical protein
MCLLFRWCYFPITAITSMLKHRTHKDLLTFRCHKVRRVFWKAITKHYKTALEMGKTIFEASENESGAAKIAADALKPPRGSAGLFEEAGTDLETDCISSTPRKVNN